MDFTTIIKALEKDKQLLPIYNSEIIARPPIKGVAEENVVPYLLAMAYKIIYRLDNNLANVFLKSKQKIPEITNIEKEKNGLFSYYHIYEAAFNYLIDFVNFLQKSNSAIPNFEPPLVNLDYFQEKNRRHRQEDRYFYALDLENYVKPSLARQRCGHPTMAFGVFDGHSGGEVAEHCSILAPFLLSKYVNSCPNDENSSESLSIPQVLAQVFRQLNQSILQGASKYSKERLWRGGSTGTICVIHAGKIYTAWVGDSQAWLVFQNSETKVELSQFNPDDLVNQTFIPGDVELLNSGMTVEEVANEYDADFINSSAMPLTDMLHKASNPEEFVSVARRGGIVLVKRDENLKNNNNINYNKQVMERDLWRAHNSFVPQAYELETGRVSGTCEVSRSFGDEQHIMGMHALPSITVCPLMELLDCNQPLAIVLASDGLWDNRGCSGPTVGRIVQQYSHSSPKLLKASELLAKRAFSRRSQDNITVICVQLTQLAELLRSLKGTANHLIHQPVDPNEFGLQRSGHMWPLGNRTASTTNVSWAKDTLLRGPNLPKTYSPSRPFSDSFAYSSCELGISSPVRLLELD
ncbi:hypothetical protein Ciccas_006497 [Cichlidogyrus casuarinus]|uniref:PPM-type phosphatase domain-containing protein n=1 Tax=Cichlidogyrus casuarinus TaxID=1844966 RepID=A0ABD2Q5M7_9PLAT